MMAIYIQDTMGAEGRPKLDWGEEGNSTKRFQRWTLLKGNNR